jgi:NTP pyrophosphatase (non-canonical NTP hydrolase)
MLKIFGKETQETIAAWAIETFGDVKTTRSILTRAGCEMAELVHAIECDEPLEKIASEIADVIIVLCRYSATLADASYRGVAGIHSEKRIALWAADALHSGRPRACVGYLSELAQVMRIDLGAAIDAKMTINRSRKWERKGAGHGQHIRAVDNQYDSVALRLAREYRAACVVVQPAWSALLSAEVREPRLAHPVEREQYVAACRHADACRRALLAHASAGVSEVGA